MTTKNPSAPPPVVDAPTPVPTSAHPSLKPVARQPFRATREERRSALTHDQIADDLAAFERDGGRIEVLGNTPMLRTIPLSPSPASAGAQKRREPMPTATDSEPATPSIAVPGVP